MNNNQNYTNGQFLKDCIFGAVLFIALCAYIWIGSNI